MFCPGGVAPPPGRVGLVPADQDVAVSGMCGCVDFVRDAPLQVDVYVFRLRGGDCGSVLIPR
eukprot:4725986-Lingulodinium_polyedra.AAC.1